MDNSLNSESKYNVDTSNANKVSLKDFFSFIFFSAICLFLGIGLSFSSFKDLLVCSEKVTATVIEYHYVEHKRDKDDYFPVYSYAYNGKEYKTVGRDSSNSEILKGERVKIRINPDDPQQICDNIEIKEIIISLFFIVVGVSLLLGSIIYYIKAISKNLF